VLEQSIVGMNDLTYLLQQAKAGDDSARERLFAVAYNELHSLARTLLRGGGRNTLLDTTVLVHESFMRFVQAGQLYGNEEGQFFCYAARVMRSVIVDFARQRQAARRGGDVVHVAFDTKLAENLHVSDDDVVRINDALEELQKIDDRLVTVVELRYFVGMTETRIAEVLGVTDRTVRRDWEKAKLLLTAALR
jgi:RNA polymerase sigma factor (TIGR02999 family)